MITAKAEGGAVADNAQPEAVVVAKPQPVVVAEPEPVVVAEPEPALVAKPEPIYVAEPGPVFAEGPGALEEPYEEVIVEEDAPVYGAPEAVYAPVEAKVAVEPVAPVAVAPVAAAPVAVAAKETQKAELVGPSGSISTDGENSVVSGPASTTITGPAVAVPVPKPLPVLAVPKFAPLPAPVIKFAVPEGPKLVSVEIPKPVPVSISVPKAPLVAFAQKVVEPFPGLVAGPLYTGYPFKGY